MGEDRPGEGPVTSPQAAKENLGRGFLRFRHEGGLPRPTEHRAAHLSTESSSKPPTKQEMDLQFKRNKKLVASLRAAGFSDLEIYEELENYS